MARDGKAVRGVASDRRDRKRSQRGQRGLPGQREPRGRRWALLLAPLLLLPLGAMGCSGLKPSASYADRDRYERTPVLILPGVTGSRLVDRDSLEPAWEASLRTLLTGHGLEDLALPLDGGDDGLIPRGIIREVLGRSFYGGLVEAFSEAGYRCAPAHEMTPTTDCVVVAWDWRRDLASEAGRVDEIIDRLAELRGDPTLRVDAVGHSAGGMLLRYFARFGARDVLDVDPDEVEVRWEGGERLRRLVFLGTPHLGSIYGLQRAMRGEKVGLARVPPEIMATFPSVFQLLPHPERQWMIDLEGRRLERRLFDPAIWREAEESIYGPEVPRRLASRFPDPEEARAYFSSLESRFLQYLQRGQRFHEALSRTAPDPPLEITVVGADCIPTPSLCLLDTKVEPPRIFLLPEELVHRTPGVDYDALMLEPGDGRVARSSLLVRDLEDPQEEADAVVPIHHRVLTCSSHSRLPAASEVWRNVLQALLL